ncbi:MAG: aldehyde dehydrogenase [Bdellovibrionota bacterium]
MDAQVELQVKAASMNTSYGDLVQKQRKFFMTGASRPIEFRKEALLKLKNAIIAKEAEIMKVLAADLGKPKLEAYSTEISYVVGEITHMIKNLNKLAKPKRVWTPSVLWPSSSYIYSEPFGSTLIIAPWNYPFQLALSPLVGAVAAGNTVILKPSEMTPETQKFILKLIAEVFAPEHVACIGGGIPESEALLNEKFDFIFFTGSTRVGKIVMQKAAAHLTPVCLELGGKSPCIVAQDIELQTAARRIIWGKFMNASQTCVAPDYVYVHKNIANQFIESLKKTITEFYGPEPIKSDSLARIVGAGHFSRLSAFIKADQLICGGQTDAAKLKIAPTLLKNVSWSDPVMKEEIFGPILPIFVYENIDEALTKIASEPKPLSFYLFTKNKDLQDHVLSTMPFGGACVNDCIIHLANPNLPFGGIGESGMGRYHGNDSFEVFSHKKSVLKKWFALDATMRYPPYTDFKMKLIRFFVG